MDNVEIKKLLVDIPTKLCRNMNRKFISSILRELTIDLSQHHLAILRLLDVNKRLFVTEVVDTLSITKPQMTASVDKLIKMGYVKRINDVNDRRKIYLSITQKGTEITSIINQNIDIQLDKILMELTKEEIDILESGLKVLQRLCKICITKHYETEI